MKHIDSTYCSTKNCSSQSFLNDKCVLHCCKTNEFDSDNEEVMKTFHDLLFGYIVRNLKNESGIKLEEEVARNHINNPNSSPNLKIYTNFYDIHFPSKSQSTNYQFYNLLSKLTGFASTGCTFNFSDFNFKHLRLRFIDCTFNKGFNVDSDYIVNTNYEVIPSNKNDLNFLNCVFLDNIFLKTRKDRVFNFMDHLFQDCNFKNNNIKISNFSFDKAIFFRSPKSVEPNIKDINLSDIILNDSATFFDNCKEKISLNSISISDSILNSSLILNGITFKQFTIKNCKVKNKFEFRSNEGESFEVTNTNFEKHTDFYNSAIQYLKFNTCVVESFSSEECTFGERLNNELQPVNFEYVTFKSLATFRGSKFFSGLNLDRANFNDHPNFLNCEVIIDNTTRETFRIIKNSFDQVGNYTEGNKYFAKESEKLRGEGKWYYPSKFILFFNFITSNFGQFFWLPVLWLIYVSYFYYYVAFKVGREAILSFIESSKCLLMIHKFSNNLTNLIFRNNDFIVKDFEFLSLIIYILYASLLWQTIVAIKRHTKR